MCSTRPCTLCSEHIYSQLILVDHNWSTCSTTLNPLHALATMFYVPHQLAGRVQLVIIRSPAPLDPSLRC